MDADNPLIMVTAGSDQLHDPGQTLLLHVVHHLLSKGTTALKDAASEQILSLKLSEH